MTGGIAMTFYYPAQFTPFLDGSQGYTVEFPDLPGCVTQGSTLEESFEAAFEAGSFWIYDELRDNNQLPSPSPLSQLSPRTPAEFYNIVKLDLDLYADKFGQSSVRKNLTLPKWLASAADSKHVNYSKLLQSALLTELNLSPR
jgi:predicted RNase H-like HicB family nuclease